MASQLKIDQAGLPAGLAGVSRTDGLDTGATVTLENTGSGSTTTFRLLDVPLSDTTAEGSLAVTGNPKIWEFTPTAGAHGTYLIELIEDLKQPTEKRERRILGMRLPSSGLLIPALNEIADFNASLILDGPAQIEASDNNAQDYTSDTDLNLRRYAGWWRMIFELHQGVEAIGGGGGSAAGPSGALQYSNGAGLFLGTGNATLDAAGNLNAAGLIADPIGLKLTEQAADPGATGAGEGTIWVRNDAPSVLMFTDDAGTDYEIPLTPSGVAGANREIQYNDAGSFGASAAFQFTELGDSRILRLRPGAGTGAASYELDNLGGTAVGSWAWIDTATEVRLIAEAAATNGLLIGVNAGSLRLDGGGGEDIWPAAQAAGSLQNDGAGNLSWGAIGTGDVVGPASATDNALARFDTATGKLIQNGPAILTDAGALSGLTTLTLTGAILGERRNIISPPALAATTNNYSPTDWQTAGIVRLTLTGSQTLTGLAAPTLGGTQIKVIENLDSGDILTIAHENVSSTAANRFDLPGNANITIAPGDTITLLYDATTARWVPIGLVKTASGSGDVVGPASAVDNRVATFDGATGKLIQDGGFLMDPAAEGGAGAFSWPGGVASSGNLRVDAGWYMRWDDGGNARTVLEMTGAVLTLGAWSPAAQQNNALNIRSGVGIYMGVGGTVRGIWTSSGLDMENHDLFDARTVTYNGVSDHAGMGTIEDIEWNLFTIHRGTNNSNCTLTFIDPPGPATGLTLILTNGGAFSLTFPANVVWAGGSPPAWTVSGRDIIEFTFDGVDYFGKAQLNVS